MQGVKFSGVFYVPRKHTSDPKVNEAFDHKVMNIFSNRAEQDELVITQDSDEKELGFYVSKEASVGNLSQTLLKAAIPHRYLETWKREETKSNILLTSLNRTQIALDKSRSKLDSAYNELNQAHNELASLKNRGFLKWLFNQS